MAEIGLIIVFLCSSRASRAFRWRLPSAAAVISFAIIAALDSGGYLIHKRLINHRPNTAHLSPNQSDVISVFRYPDLPRIGEAVFIGGWETAIDRNPSFVVNRMNERVLAGQSIENCCRCDVRPHGHHAGRSKIADDLLTTMSRVFGGLPGGLPCRLLLWARSLRRQRALSVQPL
jgi:hypothetical protein